MRIVGEIPRRAIEHFGSEGFLHSRVARGDVHASVADLDGVIGGHPAASRQLLVVVVGRVSVRNETAAVELGPREAVEWEAGEWHETVSLEPSVVLLFEGDYESFV